MIGIKTILYLVSLFFCMAGSVFYHPFIGIIGYILSYNINPVGQWWGEPLTEWGVRYSMFLALSVGIGIFIHRPKLKFNRLLESQETLLILFVGLIWISILLGFGYSGEDSNAVKMTKVAIILLMASHVITDLKRYEIMVWVLIVAGFYLGYQSYTAPVWRFVDGRLDYGIGGSDLSESNVLASHFAMLLPLIGIMFLKSDWKRKAICLVSGVFVINAIVLCRSRGAFLGCLIGTIAAAVFSVPTKRKQIILSVIIGIIGAAILIDPAFLSRMSTITTEESQMGESSRGRLLAWKAALSMTYDYPLGVGEGNFKKYVDQYEPDIPGKDTHSTFLRCLAELGIQGFVVLALLIANAFRILGRLRKQVKGWSNEMDFQWHIYGLKIAIIIFITCGITMTLTYIEELYWLLIFPVFLQRAVENEAEQHG